MVKMRQTDRPAIRAIEFAPPRGVAMDMEVIDLETMRRRAGIGEFRGAQRVGVDILLHIERGATVHAVDLVAYDLVPGDTLWVHAGQVQQWGDIRAIDGPSALLTSRAVARVSRPRSRATGMALLSHFPAGPGVAGPD